MEYIATNLLRIPFLSGRERAQAFDGSVSRDDGFERRLHRRNGLNAHGHDGWTSFSADHHLAHKLLDSRRCLLQVDFRVIEDSHVEEYLLVHLSAKERSMPVTEDKKPRNGSMQKEVFHFKTL